MSEKKKPPENFKRPKCLQYSIKLLSSSKALSVFMDPTLVERLLEIAMA